MELVFGFFGTYLIEVMAIILLVALVCRFFAYRSSKFANIYYTSFTRELELNVEKDKEANKRIMNIDIYLSELLGKVGKKLPSRSVRFANKKEEEVVSDPNHTKTFSLREYMDGKQGLLTNIQSESSVFHCKTPPNFTEVTSRIMEQDGQWTKMLKHLPIAEMSRMIDTLPQIFVVLGVFGTFIGIAMALPEIANIDFNDLDASAGTLMNFVLKTTFAMKTSIAGIFFSLILTVLNTLFPITGVRYRIFKKVEASLQMLWFHIHQDQSDAQILKDVMPKMLAVLERIEDKINSSDEEKADEYSKLLSEDTSDHNKKAG
ncbi:hypothetical protein N9N67_12100 [Bacteriovoracaceae bacterium]|nr:hypothetical protein [Bacteriovoracaceae bacterium]